MISPIEPPLVSILIPCKNAEPYLEECIESVVSQSYNNWELIIVDDNSEDQSLSIIQKWSDNHQNIRYLRNDQSGIITALRMAYTNSTGQLITRMDADDIMTRDKLKIMVSQMTKSGKGYVATGKVEYFRNDKPLGDGYRRYAEWLNSMSVKGQNFEGIYKECVIASPCWMIYRQDLDEIGAFGSDIYPEDYDLVFRMYQHDLTIIPCTDNILHLWRDHGDRASRNDENYRDNRFLDLKIKYFIDIDYESDSPMILWGAGSKGKYIAQQLNSLGIEYHWITNNERKIDHNIYGKILQSTASLHDIHRPQVIISVANSEDQRNIKEAVQSNERESQPTLYWFC